MKILLATDTYPPHVNGTAYFIYRYAHALAQKGHKVYVVAPSTQFKNVIEKDKFGVTTYRIKSLPVFFYPDFRFTLPILNSRYIKKLVKKTKPDIVHLQQHFMIGKDVFDAAKKENIPMVGTNHFLPENLIHYFPLPTSIKELIVKNAWRQFARIYNQLGAVTTPTPTAAKIIEDVGLKIPVVAVSNGIDLKRFNPKNKNSRVFTKYHIPKDVNVLLFVGRLDKEKQVDLLLKSVSQASKNVGFHFAIVGIGAQKSNLEKVARKLGIGNKVTFTGFVKDEDLPALYGNSKVFIIAGLAELQSIATMEAMASGLPVIAANANALPELVHNNENGFLVSKSNHQEYARKIEKLMSDEKLRAKMAKKSLAIIEKHSENASVSQFTEIYKKVLKNSKKSSTL